MDLTPRPSTPFKRIFNCCCPTKEGAEEETLADGPDASVAKEPFFLYRPGVAVPQDMSRVRVYHSVEVLPAEAFRGRRRLKEVVLPEGLRKIGAAAFRFCSSLERIDIPSTVTVISGGTFWYCTSLKEVVLPRGLLSIGGLAFMDCASLERIALPSTLTAIDHHAFDDCVTLRGVELMGGTLAIGAGAFRGCRSLGQITIPPKAFVINTGAHRHFNCRLLMGGTFHPTIREQAIIAPACLQSMSLAKLYEVSNEINAINNGHRRTRDKKLARVRHLVGYYEKVDVTTILELALWKSKMDEWIRASGNLDKQYCQTGADECSLGPREECRINCGADIIIPNVLPFL